MTNCTLHVASPIRCCGPAYLNFSNKFRQANTVVIVKIKFWCCCIAIAIVNIYECTKIWHGPHKDIVGAAFTHLNLLPPLLSAPRYLFVSKRASYDPLQVNLPNSQNDTTHFNQNFPPLLWKRTAFARLQKPAKQSQAWVQWTFEDSWSQYAGTPCKHILLWQKCKNVLGQKIVEKLSSSQKRTFEISAT